MSKSTRSAPPKRLSTGLDSPSARRASRRSKKAPKRVAFDLNLGTTNGNGEGGVNEDGAGGGESSVSRGCVSGVSASAAPKVSVASRETQAARNARKIRELEALRAREEKLLYYCQEQARRQREFIEEEERRTREHAAEEERQAREHANAEEQAIREEEERCVLQDAARAERLVNNYNYCLVVVIKEVQRNGSVRAKWFQRVGTADLKQGKYDNYALDVVVGQGLEQTKIDGNALDYVVVIKSDNRSATKQRVSIPDSSFEVWMEQVESTIKTENRKYTDYYLEIIVEIISRPPAASAAPAAASISAFDAVKAISEGPRQRRTRTVQQEKRAACRRDANEDAGNWSEKLIDKLLCVTDTCSNEHGFCWISWDGTHYNINSTQKSIWADVLPSSRYGASIDWLPQPLYEFLIRKQEPVTKDSRRDIQKEQKNDTKDRIKRLHKLALQQTKLNMIISMASASRQQQSMQQQYSPPTSYPIYQTQMQPQPHPQLVSAPEYTYQTSNRLFDKNRDCSVAPLPPRDSSSIERSIEERHIIQDFWNWKLNAANDTKSNSY